jgi:DNA-binding NarL/FixJ family response regulator
MAPTRIVIVHDNAIFRQGLRKLFDEHPEFFIVGEASNGTDAIDTVNRLAPDILLLDLQLGDMTGLNVLQRMGREANCKTILLWADIQREDEINAILLGASGIVSKYAAADTLFKSIRSVLGGEIWMKRDLMTDLVAISGNSRNSLGNSAAAQIELTARELDIVRAVSQGLNNKEISAILGISPFTVKHYLTRIFGKLWVNNRVELTLFAKKNGLAANTSRGAQAGHSQDS